MERTTNEESAWLTQAEFPLSICPNCKIVQTTPILTERLQTTNLICINCNYKFCSYCGNDRHYLMSCRKELPVLRNTNSKDRV